MPALIGSGPVHSTYIPAGQQSVVVEIKALEDFNHESNEGVRLSLVGTPVSAFVGFWNWNHAPVFGETSNNYTVYVSPYAAPGSPLPNSVNGKAVATATDSDVGDTITYRITTTGTAASFFTINPTTGLVSLAGTNSGSALSANNKYSIQVEAKDSKGKVTNAIVDIYKPVRIGIGGVDIAIEGNEATFSINFIRFDASTTDDVVTFNVSSTNGVNFKGLGEFVNNDPGAIKIFTDKKVTILKSTPVTVVKLVAKADGILEGIGNFKIDLKTSSDGKLVPIDTRSKISFNGKNVYGSKAVEFRILDSVKLYVKGTNDSGIDAANPGIHYNDINQNRNGNCDMLSPIAATAILNYTKIKNMITENLVNGIRSYDVNLATGLRNVPLSELFVDTYNSADLSSDTTPAGESEIWPLVIERAIQNSYSSTITELQTSNSLGVTLNGIAGANKNARLQQANKPMLFGTVSDFGINSLTFPGVYTLASMPGDPTSMLDVGHMYFGFSVSRDNFDNLGEADYLLLHDPHGEGKDRYVKLDATLIATYFHLDGVNFVGHSPLTQTNSPPDDMPGFYLFVAAANAADPQLDYQYDSGASLSGYFGDSFDYKNTDITITLPTNTCVFGIDMMFKRNHFALNPDNIGTHMTVKLSDGSLHTVDMEPSSFLTPNNIDRIPNRSFFGFISDAQISSITFHAGTIPGVNQTNGGYSTFRNNEGYYFADGGWTLLDNLVLGASPATVPEPTSMVIFGSCMVALGRFAIRRKQK